MTKEQEEHLEHIQSEFIKLVNIKYRRGQDEHGGDLFRKNSLMLIDCAIDEAIDQVVYLITIRDQLIN